jgi:hypothetical protein
MWRWVALIWMAGDMDQASVPQVLVADNRLQRTVVLAVQGAQGRLAHPDCQRLFTDFRDGEGHPLLDRLQASMRTASTYLAEQVWFVADDDSSQCRQNAALMAFTAPGYHVVHVCSARFAQHYARQPASVEIIVIHEMLHTLGLGENPPSSAAITRQVTKRCWH